MNDAGVEDGVVDGVVDDVVAGAVEATADAFTADAFTADLLNVSFPETPPAPPLNPTSLSAENQKCGKGETPRSTILKAFSSFFSEREGFRADCKSAGNFNLSD